jgi:cation:H+ antiporter
MGVVLGKEILDSGDSAYIINRGESIFLVIIFFIYLGYSFLFKDDYIEKMKLAIQTQKATLKNYLLLLVGIIAVVGGAKLTVDATIKLSELLNIGIATISMAAIALGTSLPELFVSYRAAKKDKPELAVGNILGSCIFNILMLIGIPGLFSVLIVDEATLIIGLPFLAAATLIFVISGITNKVHLWDGTMYLMLYILFISKLFGIF